MDTKLLEVALALVVIYLVLSLAGTQITEFVATMTDQRPKTLERILIEATMGDARLVDKLLHYAPVFALSKGQAMPSAIPPDLFATSFLAVINDGIPPRTNYRSPLEFIDHVKLDPKLTQLLRSQAIGNGVQWDGFEYKLGRWYADICDRAEGWYKRSTSKLTFAVALALAFLGNVDSSHIVQTMMQNDDARISLFNLGELIAAQKLDQDVKPEPAASSVAPAQAAPPLSAAEEVDKALGSIRAAANADPQLFGFGNDQGTIARECTDKKSQKTFDSNYDAWSTLLPSIIILTEQASLGISFAAKEKGYVIDSAGRTKLVYQAMVCTTAISAWVRKARYAVKNTEAAARLAEANAALDRARERMKEMVAQNDSNRSVLRSYAMLGDAVRDCVDEAEDSRPAFDRCLAAANKRVLPVGWPTRAGQFCSLNLVRQPDGDKIVVDESGNASIHDIFGCRNFEGSDKLKLAPIQATVEPIKVIGTVLGWLLTAVMVSLGAPFWYGVLGKVATLRMAGRVRGLDRGQAQVNVADNRPLESAPAAAVPPPASTFEDARTSFEAGLTPKSISRLQIALNVAPTGRLDEVTRNAIAQRLKDLGQPADRELDGASYLLLTGRNAERTAGQAVSGVRDLKALTLHELDGLIGALNTLFPAQAPASWPPLSTNSDFDDVRARVVLYRFKADRSAPPNKTVVKEAREGNPGLMRIDDPVRMEIVNAAQSMQPFTRDPAPWLDWAYGELGIREIAGKQHTPRIVHYLATIGGARNSYQDETPWCGAFVGWVLEREGILGKHLSAANLSKPDLLRAENWKTMGSPRQGPPQPGDVCIIERQESGGSRFHVAFLAYVHNGQPWLIGGNQSEDSVTMVAFKSSNLTFRDLR